MIAVLNMHMYIHLHYRARTIAETCEQQIMQKVMKEVWYVCLESLHRMLLPMLKWEHEGMQALHIEFPSTHYSPKQCAALEVTMDILKVCFVMVTVAFITSTCV